MEATSEQRGQVPKEVEWDLNLPKVGEATCMLQPGKETGMEIELPLLTSPCLERSARLGSDERQDGGLLDPAEVKGHVTAELAEVKVR